MVTEQRLLLDCVLRLNATVIAQMLTGSMAGNGWGIPPTTHDLDFVIELAAGTDLVSLGKAAGGADYVTVSAAIKRLERRIAKNQLDSTPLAPFSGEVLGRDTQQLRVCGDLGYPMIEQCDRFGCNPSCPATQKPRATHRGSSAFTFTARTVTST
jgi:hypothetical protein